MIKYWTTTILLMCCSLTTSVWGQADLMDSLSHTWANVEDESLAVSLRIKAMRYIEREVSPNLADDLGLKSLAVARELGNDWLVLRIQTELAFVNLYRGDMAAFHKYWKASFAMSEQLRDTTRMAQLLNLRSTQLTRELKYDSAFVVYYQALDLAVAADDFVLQNTIYNNIAITFGEQGLLDKAMTYFRKAKDAGVVMQDSFSAYLGNINMARCFVEMEQADSAGFYLQESEKWRTSTPSDQGIYDSRMMAGRIAKLKGEKKEALVYFKQALRPSTTPEDRVDNLMEVGLLYQELGQLDSAIISLEAAEVSASAMEVNISLRDILPALSSLYAATGQPEKAYNCASRSLELKDKYLDEELQRQVAEMEAKYQVQRLNEDNENLRLVAKTREASRQQRKVFEYSGILAFLIISGLLLLLRKRNKKITTFNTELEKEVLVRTEELETANTQLKGYLEDLRMFTHVTSHDLKAPLRNISGFSSLLERRIDKTALTEDTTAFLGMIRSNAQQMHLLIEGIQFYTRMDTAEEEYALEDIELTTAITSVEETLRSVIDERQARISYPADLPVVQTSASVLQIVLKNLIENGIKYNRSSPPVIKLSYKERDQQHAILVHDNGIGIEGEYQEQIFELFKRLHNQGEFTGTGMGLAISRKLAQRVDGDITLASVEGEGSTFTLLLPRK